MKGYLSIHFLSFLLIALCHPFSQSTRAYAGSGAFRSCRSAQIGKSHIGRVLSPSSLHTEILEHFFGPVQVRVIAQNNQYRVVNIGSKAGESPALFTRAFSMRNASMSEELRQVHQQIAGGSSMGRTFKAHG